MQGLTEQRRNSRSIELIALTADTLEAQLKSLGAKARRWAFSAWAMSGRPSPNSAPPW